MSDKTRNSKLEYFLKKNLPPSEYNDIRLYEAVIVRSGNSLAYKQAVVTGQDLYLTDTPPRVLTHLLHASAITHVDLVHDLPEFLRGGVRDQTTHITLRYHPSTATSRHSSITTTTHPHLQPNSKASSSTCINEEGEESDPASPHPSPDHTPATHRLAKAAHDTATVCSPHPSPTLPHSIRSLSPPLLSSNSGDESIPDGRHHHHHLPHSPRQDHHVSSLNTVNAIPALIERTHMPIIADLLTTVSARQLTRSSTPDALPQTRATRSLSALDTYPSHTPPFSFHLPTRSKSVLDKPTISKQRRQSQSISITDELDGQQDEKEIHLYTLSTSTLLFNLLHSLWVASCLARTQEPHVSESDDEKVERRLAPLQAEVVGAATLDSQFSALHDLQLAADKYPSVRRLVWRDAEMIKTIRSYMRQYTKLSSHVSRTSTSEEELQERQDQLEVLAAALETLATCLRGTQLCPFKIKTLKHNKYDCLCNMICEAMKTPEVPSSYKLTCERWLTDFRELSSQVWENLPESELLKLVQEVTHASTSALYELLGCVNELTWVCATHIDSQESPPSLTAFLQHVGVEGWLAYSVPQLLTLLQPDQGGEGQSSTIEGGYRVAMLHQYLSVLAALLHHSPRALQYCTNIYAEELRYYVQESLVGSVVGNSPLRPHTLKLVRFIAQLVRAKSALRTR